MELKFGKVYERKNSKIKLDTNPVMFWVGKIAKIEMNGEVERVWGLLQVCGYSLDQR